MDVDAVNGDCAAINFIEAHKEVNQGGLASAGWTNDRNAASRLNGRGQTFNDRTFGVVAEYYLVEYNAPNRVFKRHRLCCIGCLLWFVEEFKHPFRGRRRRLQDIGDIGGLDDWLVELLNVLTKRLDISDYNMAVNRQPSTRNSDAGTMSPSRANTVYARAS